MPLTVVVPPAEVAAMQRASALAYQAARVSYAAGHPDDAVALQQQVARALDVDMVAVWGWCTVPWVRPGDQVSNRGLVYAPDRPGTYGDHIEVYTSSSAERTATWLKAVDKEGKEVIVHLDVDAALAIADDLTRFATRDQ